MKRLLPLACVLLLALTSCGQMTALQDKVAPVVARACAEFRTAEADLVVQMALSAAQMAAGAYVPGSGVATAAGLKWVRSAGDKFCSSGPPAGDNTTPEQRAAWLADVTFKMLGATGALQ